MSAVVNAQGESSRQADAQEAKALIERMDALHQQGHYKEAIPFGERAVVLSACDSSVGDIHYWASFVPTGNWKPLSTIH
jgi:hypothetical protein